MNRTSYAFRHFDTLRVAARAQQPQYARRVLGRIDRLHSGTTGARRSSVHPLCVGHLNVRRIHQHDPAEILRCPCCVDFSPEPILVQLWQHTGMVNMRVRQKYHVDLSGQYWEQHVFKNVDALLHAIVDQEVSPTALQKRAASCHLMRCANECKFHGYSPSLLFRSDVFYKIPLRLLCSRRAICCSSQNAPEQLCPDITSCKNTR